MIAPLHTPPWAEPIAVHWVNRAQVGAVIEAFGYYLLRGLKAADLPLAQLADNLVMANCWLGVAYQPTPFRPLGIWVTDLREGDEDHGDFVTIYALAGERLPAWVPQIEELVMALARANDCATVRFFGRAAYKSLVDGLEIIGSTEDGRALLFEKKVTARVLQ